jgi:hypothetical protein
MSGKSLKPEWLDDFISHAWFPSGAAELRHLKRKLAPHANNFKQIYRPIRNSIFAHRLITDEKNVTDMFALTNRNELGSILDFCTIC